MGWKGTVRSINAANNRHNRSVERRNRLEQKELDKLRKKVAKIEENREKVLMALKGDFAADKLTKQEYEKLQERMADVTDELLIFGKTPAVTLCKKYVCGKIDREKFDLVRAELVPEKLDQERKAVIEAVAEKQAKLEAFVSSCNNKEKCCNKCGKEKKWYSLFGHVDGLCLCRDCTKEHISCSKYEGFEGEYLSAEPCEITENMKIDVALKQSWL